MTSPLPQNGPNNEFFCYLQSQDDSKALHIPFFKGIYTYQRSGCSKERDYLIELARVTCLRPSPQAYFCYYVPHAVQGCAAIWTCLSPMFHFAGLAEEILSSGGCGHTHCLSVL